MIELPEMSRILSPDVVFIPYETPVERLNVPYAMLCHDVPEDIWISQEKVSGKRKLSLTNVADSFLIRRAIKRAELVFCNSEYVARWAGTITGKGPECLKIAPCAPAVETFTSSASSPEIMLPDGYILAFFTGDPRENLATVLKIYDKLIRKGIREKIVICGLKRDSRKELDKALQKYEWKDRVLAYDFITLDRAEELVSLYRNASLYLDLSMHEGFGMQVIEAMTYKTPVVCSNKGALPEVVGDGAVLVEPENLDAIVHEVLRLLTDTAARDEQVLRGIRRAELFSWKETAGIILEGIRDCIARKGANETKSFL
jgi:glycosyltransferase involved in cell wall biosynthesis